MSFELSGIDFNMTDLELPRSIVYMYTRFAFEILFRTVCINLLPNNPRDRWGLIKVI